MPKLLKTPFAVDAAEGFRTDIQESTGAAPNSATYQVGFPPVTMQSIASNGMPPKGSDLNGVLYDITDNLVFLTQGGGYGFDSAYATSIGGYPLNARLRLTNGDIVKSTIDANTNDPNSNMTGWLNTGNAGEVESIAELLAIQNPKNGDRVFVKSRNAGTGKGGGYFEFHTGSEKDDGGMFFKTSTGSWHRIIVEAWHNVQWWGAVANGVTDDTGAIKLAIKAHRQDTPVASMPKGSFCTLYFPPSEGAYIVTDTIYTLPYLRLKGDSTKGGSTTHNHTKYMTKIGAKFPNTVNYAWVISTENYINASNELLKWNSVCTGEQYDAGYMTGSFGSCVEDLWIENITPENRIYGGVRFIAAPQASIERCWIKNFDVCVLFTGSWDIRVDVGTVSNKCGVALWGSSNGIRLDGYQHANPSVQPLPNQLGIFETSTQTTYGVYCQYTPSVSSTMLICEYHKYGIFAAAESSISILSAYLEANDCAIFASSSSFDIGNITGVKNNYTVELGGGSVVDVKSVYNNNYVINYFKAIYDYAIRASLPDTIRTFDSASTKVHVAGRELKDVVYVDATTGIDTNSGLISWFPVKTLARALDIVSSRKSSFQQSKTTVPVRKNCMIVFLDASEYRPNAFRVLDSLNIEFRSASNSPATIITGGQAFLLSDSSVFINGVNIKREYVNNWQPSQGMFICRGVCSIDIVSSRVDLSYPLTTVNPENMSNITLNITGGVGAMGEYAKYFKTTSKNVAINAFIRLNNTGVNLNTSADNGIEAPTEAYVMKNVTAVL